MRDVRIGIALIVIGISLFVVSSCDVHVVQEPVVIQVPIPSYPYCIYDIEYRTRIEYGPLYPLRFVWLMMALVGVVICVRALWLQRLDHILLKGQWPRANTYAVHKTSI